MPEHGSKSASVGPLGDRVRSDLNVGYEPTSGALTVEVSSKVDYLYGEAIESAVRRVADAFAVTTGRLTVDDAGALEWVILARAECCLRRAGLDGPPVLPEPAPGAGAPRNRERLLGPSPRHSGPIARHGIAGPPRARLGRQARSGAPCR